MRLRRLDLTRYGKFTNFSIDFGERIEGEPDLHLVFGQNEAGKSTSLSGFLDLLFGIEQQSRYNFLHPYGTMCVGARLELSGGTRDLVRIKRPNPTLRDPSNEPLSETLILGDLGGLDRNAYRTMFSLDDETLEAGGKSILASNGELGQLLFAASAGLSEFSSKLLDLRSEADRFAKAGGRTGELQELKSLLASLKHDRDEIDTLASDYNRLASARDKAHARYEEALAEQRTAQASLLAVRRLLTALPRLDALRQLQARLSQFADLPEAPPGWSVELPALQKSENNLRAETELAQADADRLSKDLESVIVDDCALQCSGRLDRLSQLRARFISGDLDLPKVRSDLAREGSRVRSILTRLGHENEREPGRLLLSAAQTAVLNNLILKRSGIAAKLEAANEERAKAAHALTEATRALGEHSLSAETPSFGPLLSALAAVRQSDHIHRFRAAVQSKTQLADAVETRLAALAPWTGSAEDLARLTIPDPATVESWAADIRQSDALIKQREEEVERLEKEVARSTAELGAIAETAGVVSDQEAAVIRQDRETAWAEHRRLLDADTAAAFEFLLRRDDIATGARLGHERELAELHEKKRSLARQQSEVEQAQASLKNVLSRHQCQVKDFARVTSAISPELSPVSTPSWLLSWMGHRVEALKAWEALKHVNDETQAAESDGALLRDRLIKALEQADIPIDSNANLDVLVAAVEHAVDRENRNKQLREAVRESTNEAGRRELALQRASLEDKSWQTAWRDVCSTCWLGEAKSELPAEVVREMLVALTELAPALNVEAGLADRVQAMEDDKVAFETEVERLTQELGIQRGGVSAIEAAQTIVDVVEEAGRAADNRRRLQAELLAAQGRRKQAENEEEIHARRCAAMMDRMQASSLLELATKLKDAEQKADLERHITATENEVLATLRVGSISAAQALLESKSAVDLEVETTELASRVDSMEERTRQLFAAYTQASDKIEAVGGDDRVAKIEERRRTTLLLIEEKAGRYLRLRVGIAAAEKALRAYRDQHRSSMMQQAATAFSTISRGAYSGLTTQPDKDGDVLVAMGADGSSKLAVDLSKGARFQLYLALRAAGYHEFASVRPPVPFIADDIMETFDDLRAEETLRVFESMARFGQVIYLTHHDHLCRMAERTVPAVRIHNLPT